MINNSIIQGRLVEQPILKNVGSTQVCNVTIASNTKYKDKEETLFLSICCWGNLAKFICQYFEKGQDILVQGRLHSSSWVDDNGMKKNKIELIADKIEFCGSKKQGTQQSPSQTQQNNNYNANDYFVEYNDDDFPQ